MVARSAWKARRAGGRSSSFASEWRDPIRPRVLPPSHRIPRTRSPVISGPPRQGAIRVTHFRDLPIRQKLLGAVAISVLPCLVLSCVAFLFLASYPLGRAAFLVPMAVICAASTLLALLFLFRLQRVALRELQSGNERAESSSRARSQFLAGMSHEMRTPLHGILSIAELGRQRAASLTPEKATRYYEMIGQSGR